MLPIGIALFVVAVVVVLGRLSGARNKIALATIVILGGVWAAALAIENSGWRDTDGWIDCHDYCNGWHRLGAVLFLSPLLAAVLLALLLVGGLVARLASKGIGRKRR
jgi:hypothetical protein